jgi:glycosyltransferase involved in cell wall biosynthesis
MTDLAGTPRVSVVMAVRNAEMYLEESIESILSQTLRELELLVVDDGSLDGSRGIVERLIERDNRVELLASGESGGIAIARNLGCRAARAPYIACLDADDVALPDRLARQVEFLDSNPSVALVGGALITVDSCGRRGALLRFPTTSNAIKSTLLRHNCIAHSSATFRRDALAEVGWYRFEDQEDYDLWLRFSERFELANLTQPVILYRIHTGQLSFRGLERRERPRLAVRAAGRARKAGRPDPLAGVQHLTPDVLASFDISERDVARAVEIEWISRAAILAELDRAEADALVAELAGRFGRRAEQAFEAARELLRAEACLAAGRAWAGTLHVALAFGHEPIYASRRLTSWLGDHAHGALARRK